MARHVVARTMHDLGLAAWFGGSLMGAVGLNGSSASLRNADERLSAATAGWSRFAPVNAVGIAAHLAGAGRLLQTERGRIAHQRGVARSSAAKTALTGAALATTVYSAVLNRRLAAAGGEPVLGATEPGPVTSPEVAAAQRRLGVIQWLIPAVTGSLVAVTAWQGEQQRPRQVLAGMLPEVDLRVAGGAVVGVAVVAAVVARLGRRGSASPHDHEVTAIAAESRRTQVAVEPAPTVVDLTAAPVNRPAPTH